MENKQLFAVTGNPILHSKSPLLYNYMFNENNNNACYSRINTNSAEELLFIVKDIGLKGFNITSPYKETIIPFLDDIDSKAQKLKSVNTVVNNHGNLIGYNTDYTGCITSIKNYTKNIKNQKCIIIGAGGAARSAISCMIDEGAEVTILNRTYTKAKSLANEFGCDCKSLSNLNVLAKNAEIIISTVNSNAIDLNFNNVKHGTIFLDVVYHNSKLKNSDKEKMTYIPGTEWLLYQGIEAYKIFTDLTPKSKTFIDAINSDALYTSSENIILIGFMGSGKTSVGQLLADKLSYNFIDTDLLIEQEENMSINEIFKIKGEKYFRLKEEQVLSGFISRKKCVISTGGGIITTPNNKKLLNNIGIIVWLYSPLNVCLQRIDILSKPLLANGDSCSIARQLIKERTPEYFDFADLIVSSTQNINQVANNIYNEYVSYFT